MGLIYRKKMRKSEAIAKEPCKYYKIITFLAAAPSASFDNLESICYLKKNPYANIRFIQNQTAKLIGRGGIMHVLNQKPGCL